MQKFLSVASHISNISESFIKEQIIAYAKNRCLEHFQNRIEYFDGLRQIYLSSHAFSMTASKLRSTVGVKFHPNFFKTFLENTYSMIGEKSRKPYDETSTPSCSILYWKCSKKTAP